MLRFAGSDNSDGWIGVWCSTHRFANAVRQVAAGWKSQCALVMVTRLGWALIHPIIATKMRSRKAWNGFTRFLSLLVYPVGTPKEIAEQLLGGDAGLRFLT